MAEVLINDEDLVELGEEPHAVAEEEGEHHQAQHGVLPGLHVQGVSGDTKFHVICNNAISYIHGNFSALGLKSTITGASWLDVGGIWTKTDSAPSCVWVRVG